MYSWWYSYQSTATYCWALIIIMPVKLVIHHEPQKKDPVQNWDLWQVALLLALAQQSLKVQSPKFLKSRQHSKFMSLCFPWPVITLEEPASCKSPSTSSIDAAGSLVLWRCGYCGRSLINHASRRLDLTNLIIQLVSSNFSSLFEKNYTVVGTSSLKVNQYSINAVRI